LTDFCDVSEKEASTSQNYSGKKHRVFRVRIARVDDREGIDDPYNSLVMTSRVPALDAFGSNSDVLDSNDEISISSSDIGDCDENEVPE
jgi:hypothetical protein